MPAGDEFAAARDRHVGDRVGQGGLVNAPPGAHGTLTGNQRDPARRRPADDHAELARAPVEHLCRGGAEDQIVEAVAVEVDQRHGIEHTRHVGRLDRERPQPVEFGGRRARRVAGSERGDVPEQERPGRRLGRAGGRGGENRQVHVAVTVVVAGGHLHGGGAAAGRGRQGIDGDGGERGGRQRIGPAGEEPDPGHRAVGGGVDDGDIVVAVAGDVSEPHERRIRAQGDAGQRGARRRGSRAAADDEQLRTRHEANVLAAVAVDVAERGVAARGDRGAGAELDRHVRRGAGRRIHPDGARPRARRRCQQDLRAAGLRGGIVDHAVPVEQRGGEGAGDYRRLPAILRFGRRPGEREGQVGEIPRQHPAAADDRDDRGARTGLGKHEVVEAVAVEVAGAGGQLAEDAGVDHDVGEGTHVLDRVGPHRTVDDVRKRA